MDAGEARRVREVVYALFRAICGVPRIRIPRRHCGAIISVTVINALVRLAPISFLSIPRPCPLPFQTMPFILSPNHVQLISACYPPSSALLSAGPDYRPNSQELSRLTYYATNHPGKLAKISGELQKRAVSDARKAQSGNARARA